MHNIKGRNHSILEINLPPWMIDSIRKDEDLMHNPDENILQLPLYIHPLPEVEDTQKQEIIDYVIENDMEMNTYA